MWLDDFAPFQALDLFARENLARLPEVKIPKGKILFSAGSPCQGFVILLEGCVRVGVTGENGRRLVLYRIAPGETCVQTTLCLMGALDYTAEGVAEADLRLVVIPPPLFKRLMRDSGAFSEFVFARFGARLAEMTRLVETIAFLRVDARLAGAVLLRAGSGSCFEATHQELAEDIGAAREVVSRQLALFQRAGLVRLARGRIEIGDRAGLEDLSSS
ncbi:CRP/FNR family transcriptional regulator [Rhodoblastus acidophilus]|uniref:Crp/Fnr family transcriptional regulator n=1 Tax=Rhodoblastus acidophilus TaxID=1074 RepID=UPI0022242354|nr:Crp/Fnr family transcriptional regulator [Rhodoblastus acidophilus]MCW2284661.1 CRP/FNR family transcriptional regulator [Rhodoblastus acidophilus]MCW2333614.1 CRP/FNR family transcriptional regulator [Rhodoblastus acidophilus]